MVANRKPSALEGFPVEHYSYSSLVLFGSNPVLFRIKHINREILETTRSSNALLGEAVHYGLKCFLGGDDNYPVPNDDQEALKIAYDATRKFIDEYPDGFIDWKGNVPNRGALMELALRALPEYVKEWDRSRYKTSVMVEKKLKEAVRVVVGNREIELPVPMVGYPDHVYIDQEDRVCIEDHKTTFSYSDPDSIDGDKLIQAAIYYLLVYAASGRAPYKFTFREYKVSRNKDGSPQTREYTIIYSEMPVVFDLFFRYYQDVTDALLGKQVYVPNLRALYDRDIALMAYIQRLDLPDVLEKEKKKMRLEDVAVLMQRKMAKSRSLKKFMEAKANLFTSHVSLNYDTMQAHEKIKYKLMEHGIAVNFADKIEGLAVELYRFEPSVGVKMSTLEKYQKDIEQVLGAENVRIQAPIPGTSYVGFEVPKKKRAFIELPGRKPKGLEVDLGVDVYNVPQVLALREAPHVLIAGTTGSGKSVGLVSILGQLARLPKHEVQFVLLDPKRVELDELKDDAHTLLYRDDPAEILQALVAMIAEMDKRYALFKKAKVKNLAQYREKVEQLPYIVVVVDEFGDLMVGGDGKAIRQAMLTLAQKARAAGIHLIITTQSPRAKIVDGAIKANFPTRIAFRTVSKLESEIILDRPGAELLLGKGDMLVVAAGAVMRLQGYNVD